MERLRDFSISDEVIKKIKDNNNPALLFQFMCSFDNAILNIEYFRSIGIMVIDSLLIYRLELFLVDNDKVKGAFNNYDTLILAGLINEDINAVNLL